MSFVLMAALWLRDLSRPRYVVLIGLTVMLCTILHIALVKRALKRLRLGYSELRGSVELLGLQPEITVGQADIPPPRGRIRWRRNPYPKSSTPPRGRGSTELIRTPVA